MTRLSPKAATSIGEDGRRRVIYQIHCARCRQNFGAYWPHQPPFQIYAKYFHNKGWELGRDENSDPCPECVVVDKAQRRARYRNSASALDAVLTNTEAIRKIRPPNTAPAMQADSPQPEIRNPNAAFQFGQSPEQLQRLRMKFNDASPADQIGAMRAQLNMFEAQLMTF